MRGGAKTEEDFPQNKVSQIKLDITGEGGRWLTLGHVRVSAFSNTVVLALSAALTHVLSRREFSFHLMARTRLGVQRGFQPEGF